MEPLGPGLLFTLEVIKVLAWPTATVVSIYLFLTKGERLMGSLSENSIEVKSKILTVKIRPTISSLPDEPELLSEVKPRRR
jgi:hypothetical protein